MNTVVNVYPLESHFDIAKLGYAGVYLFFLFLLQNIDCGYSLEPPRFERIATIYILSKNKKKYQMFSAKNFHYFKLKKYLFIAWVSFRYGHEHLLLVLPIMAHGNGATLQHLETGTLPIGEYQPDTIHRGEYSKYYLHHLKYDIVTKCVQQNFLPLLIVTYIQNSVKVFECICIFSSLEPKAHKVSL